MFVACVDSGPVEELARDEAVSDLRCDADEIEIEITHAAFDAKEKTVLASGCGRAARYRCRYFSGWTCTRRTLDGLPNR